MVTFTVHGRPAPQGSKKVVGSKKNGKAILVESSKGVKPWRQDVALYAFEAMRGKPLFTTAVFLEVTFFMARPASISPKKRMWPCVAPDLSKLVRSTEDALKGIVWYDDSLVVSTRSHKRYSEDGRTGAIITVRAMTEVESNEYP